MKVKLAALLAMVLMCIQPKKDLLKINDNLAKGRDKFEAERIAFVEDFDARVDAANKKVGADLDQLCAEKEYQAEVQKLVVQDALDKLNEVSAELAEATIASMEFDFSD